MHERVVAGMAERNTAAAPPTKASNPKDAIGDAKVPLWLLPTVAKIKWAMAHFAGQIKYGTANWRATGVRASTYLSAMERHMEAYKSGEELDPTDGTDHLGNIMACCAIIIDAREAGLLTDDRPPKVSHRAAIESAETLMVALKKQYADRQPRHYTIADTVAPATLPAPTPGDEHAATRRHAIAADTAARKEGRKLGRDEED